MKTASLLLIVLIALQAQPPQPPSFVVDASEDASADFPGAPRLQSFSFAQWKSKWVFIGGRITGYHAVGGGSADFLRADANRDVWVIDTGVKPAKTYHARVELPLRYAVVQAQWTSTAQLYFQDGEMLYICGGYGQDEKGEWTTFDVISKVSVPALIDGVMQGRLPAESIAFGRSPVVQSTGGGLVKLDDGYFYLVMGHSFQGSYTAFEGRSGRNSSEASQVYLNEIRKFSVRPRADAALDVMLKEKFHNDAQFHRRDLNVVAFLSARGMGLAAYGGVFTPETQLSYGNPIYLRASTGPFVDQTFEQKMNTYSCAVLVMYSEAARAMYTTFFGGISRYSWNPSVGSFVENPRAGSKTDAVYLDGLQWSDQISTIRNQDSTTIELVNPSSLPAFLGAGAVFIPSPEIARAHEGTDILALDSLGNVRTFVGYVYGGIRAYPYQFPGLKTSPPHNSGAVPTKASDMILKVYISRLL